MKPSRSSRLAAIALAALVVVFMAGVPAAQCADPIRIAGIFALTGRAAHIGSAQRDAVQIVIDEVNVKGGINGRPLELVMGDYESEPTNAVMTLKKILQSQEVVAVIGPTETGAGMALRGLIEQEKIPAFMHAGGDAILDIPLVPADPASRPRWTFKSPYRAAHAIERILTHLQGQGIRRLGLIYSNEGFGKDGQKNLEALAPARGIAVVASEAFEPKDVDMTVQLTRIGSQQADAILVWTVGPAMGIIAKNARQLGIAQPMFQCHGAGDPIFWKVAGEAGEGTMMPSSKIVVADQLPAGDPQKEKIQVFVKAYRAKFGQEPGTMVAYGADAAYIVVEAIRKAGTDRAKIREAIENTRGYVGISGVYNLSAEDHNGLGVKDIVMIRATKGGWQLLP